MLETFEESNKSNRTISNTYMYLPYDVWSPRYDPTSFYTIRMDGYIWVTSYEQLDSIQQQQQQQSLVDRREGNGSVIDSSIASTIVTSTSSSTSSSSLLSSKQNTNKRKLPTYYYRIIVYRGHHQIIIYRRYSQFVNLYQQLMIKKSPTSNTTSQSTQILPPYHSKFTSNDKCHILHIGNHCMIQYCQQVMDSIIRHVHDKKESDDFTDTEPQQQQQQLKHYQSIFAETRCKQLLSFLTYILECGPIYASHIAVRTFLELP